MHVPLHRGNHGKGEADGETYPKRVSKDLTDIKKAAKRGHFCDDPRGLVEELDDTSELIMEKVGGFDWTLTADGADYDQGGNGCAGVRSITKKPRRPCPCDRDHGITRPNELSPIPKNSNALEVGS